jgi:ribonuclease HI
LNDTTHVTIHTDGACLGNPGPGGWGTIVRWWNRKTLLREQELSGGEPDTTNNRMELSAAIAGITHLADASLPPGTPINIYSDSEYVIVNARDRLPKWRLNGWRTSDKKPVKNRDLWATLDGTCEGLEIVWRWVRGHDGDPLNERADALANLAAARFRPAA